MLDTFNSSSTYVKLESDISCQQNVVVDSIRGRADWTLKTEGVERQPGARVQTGEVVRHNIHFIEVVTK